jgi:predicted anti-sigma-YlaC factor YlaD
MSKEDYCKKVRGLLPHYLSGEVSDEERELIETHLYDCTSCFYALTKDADLIKLLKEHGEMFKLPEERKKGLLKKLLDKFDEQEKRENLEE